MDDFETFVKEQLNVMSVAELEVMMRKAIRERALGCVKPDGTIDLVAVMMGGK